MVFSTVIKILLFPLKLLKWLVLWVTCSIILALALAFPVEGLSEAQTTAISQNCAMMQQSLRQLQRVDSRTRTYLGTTYETILNKFIIPLNLRLVKNNLPTNVQLQADFIADQNDFKNAYTDYMRELEGLIATDCRAHPEEFYSKLENVRGRRAYLKTTTDNLSKLAQEQYLFAFDLRKSLL